MDTSGTNTGERVCEQCDRLSKSVGKQSDRHLETAKLVNDILYESYGPHSRSYIIYTNGDASGLLSWSKLEPYSEILLDTRANHANVPCRDSSLAEILGCRERRPAY